MLSQCTDGDLPLKKKHPHPRDACIQFEPDGHTYTIRRASGRRAVAPVSVTSFARKYFTKFDAVKIVDKYYAKWSADVSSKYHATIHGVLDACGTAEDAKAAIRDVWEANGRQASADGTRMHAEAELVCNGILVPEPSREIALLRRWLVEFEPHMQWEPVRTEWPLWYELEEGDPASPILLAGTLDLLMCSKTTDVYGLFDFKRTNPKPKREGEGPNLLGPHTHPRHHPGYAKAPLSEVEDGDFGKYAVQLNVLAEMLHARYGIAVGRNMFLVQLHPDLDHAHCVQVPTLASEMRTLFAVEKERLRARKAT